MTIQRYEVHAGGHHHMADDGKFVKYADHIAELAVPADVLDAARWLRLDEDEKWDTIIPTLTVPDTRDVRYAIERRDFEAMDIVLGFIERPAK